MKNDEFKKFTQARVALGQVGGALPTEAWLNFSYEHAAAVDAIQVDWTLPDDLGFKTQILNSKVNSRKEFLLRPDMGRELSEESVELLKNENIFGEILLVASNGLSSYAVMNHLKPFLAVLRIKLKENGLKVLNDTVFLVPNGRVGLVDQIGEILKPKVSLMLIGERPGLSSPDSLACYLTYNPRSGLSDANRNCISNIRPPHGLSYENAVFKSLYLIKESIRLKLSGVKLKDESNTLIE